jgi:hypothetical protein
MAIENVVLTEWFDIFRGFFTLYRPEFGSGIPAVGLTVRRRMD